MRIYKAEIEKIEKRIIYRNWKIKKVSAVNFLGAVSKIQKKLKPHERITELVLLADDEY